MSETNNSYKFTNLADVPEAERMQDGDHVLIINEGKVKKTSKIVSLPEVASEDSGKVLRVNSNGEWSVEPISYTELLTSAEGVSF